MLTLKRLIVQAYGVQPYQVFGGPNWLDGAEYDIDAKADGTVAKERLAAMLRTLLAERFHLAVHHDTRELRVYELAVDKGGAEDSPRTGFKRARRDGRSGRPAKFSRRHAAVRQPAGGSIEHSHDGRPDTPQHRERPAGSRSG